MFAKPYRLKSNNTLKNSEKKHLAQRIQDEFPVATEEKSKLLVPVKSNSTCMKLITHSGDIVGVYVVDGIPIMLDAGERLVPTMCALWKVPDLVPTLIIHSPVLSKLQGGAPLYLPGVAVPVGGAGFPHFGVGAPLALATQDNGAAAAVGLALLASGDMLMRSGGVCFETLHVVGDLLCKDIKFSKIERPRVGAARYGDYDVSAGLTADLTQLTLSQSHVMKEEWPSLGPRPPPPAPPAAPRPAPPAAPPAAPRPAPAHAPALIPDAEEEQAGPGAGEDLDVTEEDADCPESNPYPGDMDGLLRYCLLTFIKYEAKKVELPLKTNLLYSKHLIPLCPPDRTLDVKKSSYKKMSKFLEAMQKESLVEVKEIEKGVDAVTAVNALHPALRSHAPPLEARGGRRGAEGAEEGREGEYRPPVVTELYCVTAAVLPLFPGIRKGTALPSSEVRSAVTSHVKNKQLDSTTRGAVTIDDVLAKATGLPEQSTVKWDTAMSSILNAMTAATEVRFSDGSVRRAKSRLQPVAMQVANRSGNKKVTLVSNLETFGFNLLQLSQACQSAAAAACSVAQPPGYARPVLVIQGDQTHFMAKLLIEKYGLPKKFVDGADKALKKKK